jgi:hypothetical protein
MRSCVQLIGIEEAASGRMAEVRAGCIFQPQLMDCASKFDQALLVAVKSAGRRFLKGCIHDFRQRSGYIR